MPVICNECGGSFDGVGPGPEWGHDSLECSRVTIGGQAWVRHDVGSPEHELSTARATIAELTTRVDVLDAELCETREALRALLRFEPADLADRPEPDRQAWWAARRVVATGLDTGWTSNKCE